MLLNLQRKESPKRTMLYGAPLTTDSVEVVGDVVGGDSSGGGVVSCVVCCGSI